MTVAVALAILEGSIRNLTGVLAGDDRKDPLAVVGMEAAPPVL